MWKRPCRVSVAPVAHPQVRPGLIDLDLLLQTVDGVRKVVACHKSHQPFLVLRVFIDEDAFPPCSSHCGCLDERCQLRRSTCRRSINCARRIGIGGITLMPSKSARGPQRRETHGALKSQVSAASQIDIRKKVSHLKILHRLGTGLGTASQLLTKVADTAMH